MMIVNKSTEAMEADLLTTYRYVDNGAIEPGILHKHCAAPNLSLAVKAVVAACIVPRGSSTTEVMSPVGAASMSDNNGTGCILVAFCMVLAVGIVLGWILRDLIIKGASGKSEEEPKDKPDVNALHGQKDPESNATAAVNPAPAETIRVEAAAVAGSTAPRDETRSPPVAKGKATTGFSATPSAAACELLGKFTVVDLKRLCRLHGLPVSGRKADLCRRVSLCSTTLTDEQAQEVLGYINMYRVHGRRPTVFSIEDASGRMSTAKWLTRVANERDHLARRPTWTGTLDY